MTVSSAGSCMTYGLLDFAESFIQEQKKKLMLKN